MGVNGIANANKPILDIFQTHCAFVLEQIANNAFTLCGIKTVLVFCALGPTHTVKLIEHAILFVQKRAFGKDLLPRQIGAIARHAQDELLGAFVLVDNAVPVPRGNHRFFHTRLSFRPGKAFPMLIFSRILRA